MLKVLKKAPNCYLMEDDERKGNEFSVEAADLEELLKVLDSSLSCIKWRLKSSARRRLEIGFYLCFSQRVYLLYRTQISVLGFCYFVFWISFSLLGLNYFAIMLWDTNIYGVSSNIILDFQLFGYRRLGNFGRNTTDSLKAEIVFAKRSGTTVYNLF